MSAPGCLPGRLRTGATPMADRKRVPLGSLTVARPEDHPEVHPETPSHPESEVLPKTVEGVREALARRLGSRQEARWMVEEVAGELRSGAGLGPHERERLAGMVARRLGGEPLQYVLGHWSFRCLDLETDPRALVPRPETEMVVEVARSELGRLPRRGRAVAVDLGTGTGAIALSLVVEDPEGTLEVLAVDRDPDALALCAVNRARVQRAHPAIGGRVSLVQGSWFEALAPDLAGAVDLIVANPPYVAPEEWEGLEVEVRAEPRQALVAGPGVEGTPGMADVELIVAGAPRWLRRPGVLVVEIAPMQAGAALRAGRRAGFTEVAIERDLAGRERMLVGRL